MNQQLKNALAAAALSVVSIVTIACGSKPTAETSAPAGKDITTQKAGDMVVALQNDAGELVQGQNKFVLAFRSGNGELMDVGKVTVGSSMAMPGMAPMVAPIELQPAGKTGAYALTGDFGMSGAWKFDVRWDGPMGQGSTSFNTNVR